MVPLRYYNVVQMISDPRAVRYQLIRYAMLNGIKPAATVFGTTPKTVRKWVKRWLDQAHNGLIDQRKSGNPRPSRISTRQKQEVIRLKRQYRSWGALRLKKKFELRLSDKAIRGIWKEAGIAGRTARKYSAENS